MTYPVDSEEARWRTVVGIDGKHTDRSFGMAAGRCTGMPAVDMVAAGTAAAVAVAVAVAGKRTAVVGTGWS